MEQHRPDFFTPQRQSSVAIGIILIKFIRMTIRAFWPIFLSYFIGRRTSSNFEDIIGYIAIGFAAFNLIGSVLTYFRFYFHLEENAIVIDKGVLKRTKTNIPFERIQTINFTQNILHQIFGVVSVEIDSAGAKKSEISIDALSKDKAVALREFILAEKEQLASEKHNAQEIANETVEEPSSDLLLQLSISDLLKVGVSQNHFRSMGIIFAFVFTTINEMTDNIGDLIADQFDQYESYVVNNTLFAFLASIILVGLISFLFSLVNTFLKYFDLKLWLSQKGLKLVKGLLNREEITINKHKVQTVAWSTNPIRKIFGIYTLELEQASSTEASTLKSKIKVPGCYKQQVSKVISMVFPTEYLGNEPQHRVHALVKQRIILFYGLAPSLIGLASWFWIEEAAFYFLLTLPLSFYFAHLYHKKRSYEINEELIRSNGGTIGTDNLLTQIHKVQAVRIKQSWYQKRKNLATMELYTAAGEMTVPFITMSEALQLESFILYRIETDKREWM